MKYFYTLLLVLTAVLGSNYLIAEEVEISLSTTVVGNQEQPKILYIVPWKPPEGTQRLDQPVTSQLHQVFEHLEADELNREIRLYQKLDSAQISNDSE